ncbi:MAG: GspH/FimT family pseudopilin [Burkholderiaceae bacterium]|jgi:type IV fimbrial biogenesis protein FimT|nr:GspH/FimT family pseudopilin [Burkholderiaceae bacterium]
MEQTSIASASWPAGLCACHQRLAPRGFTLSELLVVVGIVAILSTLAAPSFVPLIERFRVRQAAEALKSTLYFARSEAIKHGGNVFVQKFSSRDCSASGNGSWNCGWVVCHDVHGDGTCGDIASSSNTEVLQRFDTPANIQVCNTSSSGTIPFNRWGLINGTAPGFNLYPSGKSETAPAALYLSMSSAGRINVVHKEDTPCKK